MVVVALVRGRCESASAWHSIESSCQRVCWNWLMCFRNADQLRLVATDAACIHLPHSAHLYLLIPNNQLPLPKHKSRPHPSWTYLSVVFLYATRSTISVSDHNVCRLAEHQFSIQTLFEEQLCWGTAAVVSVGGAFSNISAHPGTPPVDLASSSSHTECPKQTDFDFLKTPVFLTANVCVCVCVCVYATQYLYMCVENI